LKASSRRKVYSPGPSVTAGVGAVRGDRDALREKKGEIRIAVPVAKSPPTSNDRAAAAALGLAGAARIAFVALAAGVAWFRSGEPAPGANFIAIAALLVGGWPILREAAGNIVARGMTMELSISIAIVAAAAISEFLTALIITLFVLVAELLEKMIVSRGRRAIRDLLEFLPRSVTVRGVDGVRETAISAVNVRDLVLIDPGGLVPVDGIVTRGHSFVDQSRITGEAMPAEKTPGAIVYAGTCMRRRARAAVMRGSTVTPAMYRFGRSVVFTSCQVPP